MLKIDIKDGILKIKGTTNEFDSLALMLRSVQPVHEFYASIEFPNELPDANFVIDTLQIKVE